MTPSLLGWPTKAKEAPSPREVRLVCWTPTQYVLGEFQHKGGRGGCSKFDAGELKSIHMGSMGGA